jgi:hypothetical protein
MNWKNIAKMKQSPGTILTFACRDWEKTMQNLGEAHHYPSQHMTNHFPYTSLAYYWETNVLSVQQEMYTNLRLSHQWLSRFILSSGMWRHVVWWNIINLSGEPNTFIFRVKECTEHGRNGTNTWEVGTGIRSPHYPTGIWSVPWM